MSTISAYEPAINTAKYYTLVDKSLNEQLNKEEFLYYTVLSSYYKTAFDFARENKLNISAYYFERGESLLKEMSSDASRQWSALYGLPKKSYYLYKKSAFQDAELMTYQVIGLCRDLRKNGDEYLVFAELQQYHNLSRIYFFSGRVNEAIDLCRQCLHMLYSGSCILTDTSHYLSGQMDNDKDEWSTAFTYQLFVETLNTFLKVAKEDKTLIAGYVNYFLDPSLASQMEGRNISPEYQQIIESIGLLKTLATGDWAKFTKELSHYLDTTVILNQRLQLVLAAYAGLLS